MKIKGFMIKKGIQCLKDYGPRELLVRVIERKKRQEIPYDAWYQKQKISEAEARRQREEVMQWEEKPMVSICVPLYKTPEKFLCEMIDSVCNQTYENWQLCLADGSPDETLCEVINKHYEKETRIVYKHLEANLGIADNTNAAFALADGEWIGLLDHDDILAPEALYESMKAVKLAGGSEICEAVYSDEDKITEDLVRHFDPHFKPDYNVDLLRSNNYITHFFVVKRVIVEQVGGFCKEYDGSQDYDFILRCTTRAKKTAHVPRILYHWRTSENSTAENPASKMYAFEAGKRAIETHLQKEGVKATVEYTKGLGFYHVKYELDEMPGVTTVVLDELQSVNEKISKAEGEYILLLDETVEKPDADTMKELLSHCWQEQIAAVGPKLLDRKKKILSAGQILGGENVINDVYVGLPSHYYGYMHRASTQIAYSTLNMHCLVIKKEAYQAVGGLDLKFTTLKFAIADLLLRFDENGYRNVYDPYAEVHVNGAWGNEGQSDAKGADVSLFKEKYAKILEGDGHYNLNLSIKKADYTLNV